MIRRKVIVDHAQAPSPSLTTPLVRPAYLSEPSRPWHQVSRVAPESELFLERPVLVVAQVVG